MDNGANNLPSSILGDGRKFVSLLKNYLKGLQDDIAEKLGEVTKIYNTVADTPETIDEQVHSITVEEKAVNGNISLLVKWNSDNIKKYAGAVIDIKIGDFHTTLAGFSDQQWVKHYETTKTNQYLIDNIEPGQNYLIRVRGKDVYNAKSVEAKAPAITYYVEPNKHLPRPPYEGTVVFDKKGVYWSWKQYDQNQYMWTELRLDEHPGNLFNRLEVTTNLMSTEKPFGRTGTAYLYNRGVGNSYSSPLKLPYAKAVPHAPENVTVTPTLEGLRIHFDKIPEDCYGANVYINEEKFYTEDNTYNFVCAMGKYSIRVAYLDVFGEGESSTPVEKGTNEQIPPEAVHITNKTVFDDGVIVAKHIGDNAIVGTKIAEGAITTDKISANAITSAKIASSSITSDKIQAGSITSNQIATEAITADKIKAGSVTGDKIVANSITGDKIASSSVTADKIKVDSLSAISANVGTLKGGTIIGTTLKNENGTFSVSSSGDIKGAKINGSTITGTTIQNSSGTFSVSSEGVIKGATIDAQSFRKSGFEISAMKQEMYTVAHGATVPCPDGYNRDDCIYIVLSSLNMKPIVNIEYRDFIVLMRKVYPENLYLSRGIMPNFEISYSQHGYSNGEKNNHKINRCGILKDYTVAAIEIVGEKYLRDEGGYEPRFRGFLGVNKGYVSILCIAIKK